MASLVRTLLNWLRWQSPERSDGSDREWQGEVADRELDASQALVNRAATTDHPGPTRPVAPTQRTTGPRDARTKQAMCGLAVARQGFDAWCALVLQLASGRAPEGLRVAHALSLAKLKLRSLPPGLSVSGDLDLRQCQRLRRIGANTHVRGDLLVGGRCPEPPWWEARWVERSPVTDGSASVPQALSRDTQCPLEALPSGLRVGGSLRLRNCRRLGLLPDDLRVEGSIELAGCTSLVALPDPFEVNGDLTVLSAPALTSLPDRLTVHGDLRLIGVCVSRLPESLIVEGDLTLECCPRLTELPEHLSVGGSVKINRCPVSTLPRSLNVGGDLKLLRLAHLEEVPGWLSVPGSLVLSRCPSLIWVLPGVRVGKDLSLTRCEALEELPEGLRVPGVLDLRGCSRLESLPAGLVVGDTPGRPEFATALRLVDCAALRALPDDLDVKGPIDVAGSGLRDFPARLARSARVMWRGVVVPPDVVFRPETLTPAQILGQWNAELRRVMLERAGLDRVLRRANAEVLDRDTDAGGERRLVRVTFRNPVWMAEPRCYLHCRCPSTGREYLLRVPPWTRTCPQAAAWLAGFDNPETYRPVQET